VGNGGGGRLARQLQVEHNCLHLENETGLPLECKGSGEPHPRFRCRQGCSLQGTAPPQRPTASPGAACAVHPAWTRRRCRPRRLRDPLRSRQHLRCAASWGHLLQWVHTAPQNPEYKEKVLAWWANFKLLEKRRKNSSKSVSEARTTEVDPGHTPPPPSPPCLKRTLPPL
jgi:hypothetical protein